MLHVCSIFVWMMIQMQWLPLILNGKSKESYFVYMKRFILFVLLIYLGLVLKFQFSFVIDIIFKCCYLAEVFIQSDLQMRSIEAI